MTATRFRGRLWGLLCFSLGLGACKPERAVQPSSSDTADDAPARTDSLRYTLRVVPGGYDAAANVTFTNHGTSAIAYARCGPQSTTPMWSVVRTGPDSTAKSSIVSAWGCVGGVPTGLIAPGDSVTMLVWLGSTTSPNANPPIQPSERVGRFRVRLTLCTRPVAESGYCDLLPQAQRQSNAFDVVFP